MLKAKWALSMMSLILFCGCSSVSAPILESTPERDLTLKNIGNEDVKDISISINGKEVFSAGILMPNIFHKYGSAIFPVGNAVLTWEYPKGEKNKKLFNLADYIDQRFNGGLTFQISGHDATIKVIPNSASNE